MNTYQTAITLLSYREHSRLELQHKLLSRSFDPQEIATVLDKLAEQNLQSDARFVEAYVHMRMNRGYGPLRISAELRERGINNILIQKYLQENAEQWQEIAERILVKKFGATPPQNYAEKVRQIRFLQYRGFNNIIA